MAEHKHPVNRHEESDADPAPIIKFGIALAVICVGSVVFLAWLFGFLETRRPLEQAPSTLPAPWQAPPKPRLQFAPSADLKDLRAHEDQILSTYGWVNKSAGQVHIPIDRAIDLAAQRGLPPVDGGVKRRPNDRMPIGK